MNLSKMIAEAFAEAARMHSSLNEAWIRVSHRLGGALPELAFVGELAEGRSARFGSSLHGRTPTQIMSRIKATHCFFASPANALCTSDREIPNSRAIRAGVTPALNAARTAFSFP